MSSVFQNYAIYRLRAFTRLASAFHKERIPVLNFTELDTDNTDLDVSLRLRRTFKDLKSEASSGPGEPSTRMAPIAWLAVVMAGKCFTRQHLNRGSLRIQIYRTLKLALQGN